jgi:PAS domain S-box-containing protein
MNFLNRTLASPEPLVTAGELYRRQVVEVFRTLRQSAAFSFVGAVLTALVFTSAGDWQVLWWFALASAVFAFRILIAYRFDREHAKEVDLARWARMLMVGNLFAGVQWGLLGTLLFPVADVHRQTFVMMVIVSYVAGGIIPFTALKWAHACLAIPAAFPPIIYVFFIANGVQWIAGGMALFLLFCVVYLAFGVHRRVVDRLRFELENRALLEKLSAYNDELGSQNIALKTRSEAVIRAEEQARRQADVLASHVQQTLLPVIACDPDFQIVEWNQAAKDLLGYSADEVMGDNMGELLFPEERRANIKPYLAKLFADRHPTMIEFPAVARDGQQIPVRYYLTPIYGEDGGPLRISVIIIESYGDPSSAHRRPLQEAA